MLEVNLDPSAVKCNPIMAASNSPQTPIRGVFVFVYYHIWDKSILPYKTEI